jgi:hypothetical protein
VLEVDDLEDRALDVDVVAVLELVGRNRGGSVLLEPDLGCGCHFLATTSESAIGARPSGAS